MEIENYKTREYAYAKIAFIAAIPMAIRFVQTLFHFSIGTLILSFGLLIFFPVAFILNGIALLKNQDFKNRKQCMVFAAIFYTLSIFSLFYGAWALIPIIFSWMSANRYHGIYNGMIVQDEIEYKPSLICKVITNYQIFCIVITAITFVTSFFVSGFTDSFLDGFSNGFEKGYNWSKNNQIQDVVKDNSNTSVESNDDFSFPSFEEWQAEQEAKEQKEKEEAAKKREESGITLEQENAIEKATSYITFMNFSKQELVDQLEFEGFSREDSQYAVDNIIVDWKEQAAGKADTYIEYMQMSKQRLIEQLEHDGFTQEEIDYAVQHVGY